MVSSRLDDNAVQELLARFEDEVDRVELVPGPTSDAAMDALASLAGLYGEALARVLDTLDPSVVRHLAGDELIAHLMLLHRLHPDPAEARIDRALHEAEPFLGADGHAELTGIDAGVARIRVAASGCGSSGAAQALADIVIAEAPELAGVESESVTPKKVIPADSLLRRPG